MSRYVAAIDQGTTSTRFVIFDADGQSVGMAQQEHEQVYPQPGWVEHRPQEIWARTEAVIADALATTGLTAADLVAIGVTNQRETTVVWDRFTGEPVGNAIVWQDTRTDQICRDLSADAGRDRFRASTGLPLATYFSGPKVVWILDNIAALSGMNEAVSSKPLHLFENKTGIQWRFAGVGAGNGHKPFNGPNPPDGTAIHYWLKDAGGEKDTVTITISNSQGEKVRDITGTKAAGVNRVTWDLRHTPPPAPEGGAGFGGGGFGGGGPRGPLVPPGQYSVKVTAGANTSDAQPITVEEDPRIQISEADRKAWYEMQVATARLAPQLQMGMRTVTTLGTQLREVKTQLGRNPRTPEAVTKALQALLDKVEELGGREPANEPPGFAGAPLADAPQTIQQRIGFGFGGFGGGTTAAPTAAQKAAFERAQKELATFGETLRTITQTDVPALNKLLLDAGIGRINLPAGGAAGGARRPPEGSDQNR